MGNGETLPVRPHMNAAFTCIHYGTSSSLQLPVTWFWWLILFPATPCKCYSLELTRTIKNTLNLPVFQAGLDARAAQELPVLLWREESVERTNVKANPRGFLHPVVKSGFQALVPDGKIESL